ncbi:MAG: DUF4390 domain-containing protein [candidate division NC10 bacterium]|nr:DUF4390 domain-containing protein [candidate division NC10 bacterium]
MRRKQILRSSAALLVFLTLVTIGSPTFAADARITDVIVTQGSDDLLVYATLENAFTKEVEESIVNGVPTTFTYHLRLMRYRSLVPDAEVASFLVRQGVSYDLLKDEFAVVQDDGREKTTRGTKSYAQMKRWMGELRGIKVGSRQSLEKDEIYYVLVKAEIRSLKLIFPLNYLLFFLTFFNFDTSWTRSAYFKVSR